MVMDGGGMVAMVIDDGIVKSKFWVWSFILNGCVNKIMIYLHYIKIIAPISLLIKIAIVMQRLAKIITLLI